MSQTDPPVARPVPDLTSAELLTDVLLGPDPYARPLPSAGGMGGREALDAVLAAALSRPPCVVSFSGGRDSSAVLALASLTAREHGLEPPVPVSMRFPDAPEADEAEWQTMVLSALDLTAEVITVNDELEALGPDATDLLRRHGVRWPGNAYMHVPIFRVARGGTVLTGVGGDELFDTRAPRRRPLTWAAAQLPAAVRQDAHRDHLSADYVWLTEPGRRLVGDLLAADELAWPYRWDRALEHWYSSRAFAGLDGTLRLVADDFGVALVNPLLDAGVLAAMVREGGRRGFASRAQAMTWLCESTLPEAILNRTSKASFGGPLWGEQTRAFVDSWDGQGLDERWVDVSALRAQLQRDNPDVRTLLLLQTAWLHTHA